MKTIKTVFLFVVGLLSLNLSALAAEVQQLTTHSDSMDKDIGVVVVTPEGYSNSKHYPVLYLLHGYSGNYKEWVAIVPKIKAYADQYQFMIVCPDGGFNSWYLDSPIDPSVRYETYVSKELVEWVDKKFSTVKSRKGRAITGLSMGGHGALYLAFRHQDVYGAAGSMSGGVDIRPFPENWDISQRLGVFAEHPENWEQHTVMNQVEQLKPGSLKIIVDCGTSDFFYNVNCQLHEKLLEREIPHDFTTRPGSHTWEYWKNSIAFQSLFFHHFFLENN